MPTSRRKNPANPSPASDEAPAQPPAHNIWLAGLGALANAQAEGSKAFDALVQQGLDMQKRTQALATQQWTEAAQRVDAIANQASSTANPWDRLGGIFEGRVARALAALGMPSANELQALDERIKALEAAMAALHPSTGASTASPARSRRKAVDK